MSALPDLIRGGIVALAARFLPMERPAMQTAAFTAVAFFTVPSFAQ